LCLNKEIRDTFYFNFSYFLFVKICFCESFFELVFEVSVAYMFDVLQTLL
jgi:hypothetical protein